MKLLEDDCWLTKNQIVEWAYTESSKPISYDKYISWIEKNNAGPLNYLTDQRKYLRSDLTQFFPEFKSCIVFLFSYVDQKKTLLEDSSNLKLASYVTGFDGIDYHYWVKERLIAIEDDLKKNIPDLKCAYTIDAQPVLERDLAARAGLGWIGKNSMLINKSQGSYTIIAGLLLNKKLELKSKPLDVDHCGNCRACIDACPTQAIIDGERTVDANKCISTFTIELFKEATPPKGYTSSNEIYGCDICQEVCPWNRKPLNKAIPNELTEISQFFKSGIDDIITKLENISNREFRRRFKGTPLERTGRVGVLKNLRPFLKR